MMQKPWFHPVYPQEPVRAVTEYPAFIGAKPVFGFGERDFYVALVPRKLAVDMIVANHYSGRVVQNGYVHLGIFMAGEMVGAMQWGYALCPARASKVVADTANHEYLELNRMWLSDVAPRNSESRALSFAFKWIAKAMPWVRWVQSFADERCGRLGVVYQAANFLYCGFHWTNFYELDGETYHDMLLTAHKKGGQRGVFLRANLHRATKHRLRQFRYVYFIDKRWRARLKLPVKPYPKPD